MTAAKPWLPLALLVLSALGVRAAGGAEPTDARAVADGLLTRMQAAAARARDATFTFYKQEWVDGALQPEERVFVKQRFPHDLYMRWDSGSNKGRELVYREGWNSGQMRVDPGPLLPNLDLDPRGVVARQGERHTILEVGPLFIVEQALSDARLLKADPSLPVRVVDLGPSTIYGEPARCVDMTLPRDRQPRLYASRVVLCANERTGLPCRSEIWAVEGGALRVVERYGFADLHLNLGLTDADFSPDNPAYGF